jgi:signal transduction histidine kinase
MSADPLTDAAARTLIAERCQRAYLHEIRGGLQALSGAFELLARLAKSGNGDAAVVDRATTIAKRALTHHEHAMLDLVKQITAAHDHEERIELGALVDDVLRFLRNDFAGRQIQARLERSEELFVEVVRNQLRFMLLGLIAGRLDACPSGGQLSIRLARRDGSAVLEIATACSGAQGTPPHPDVVLDLVRHWIEARGGQFERPASQEGPFELALPLRA